jgi:hypothetical protein
MAKIRREIIVYTNSRNMDVSMNKRELIPTMIEEHDLIPFDDWLSEERGMDYILEVLEKAMKKNESAASVSAILMAEYEKYVDERIEEELDYGVNYQSSSLVVEVEI